MPDDVTSLSVFGEAEPPDEPMDAYLARQAERIRGLGRVAAHSIVEMGRTLIEVKGRVGHGGFLPWIEREFAWSDQTARNYMAVAGWVSTSPTVRDLAADRLIDLKAIYALAAPTTPPAAREEAVAAAKDGKRITKAEADRMIADAKEAARQEVEATMLVKVQDAETKAERATRAIVTALDEARQTAEAAAAARMAELDARITEARQAATTARDEGRSAAEEEFGMTIKRLEGLLAQERASASDPKPADVIAYVQKALGVKSLTGAQLTALAQTMGMTITIGRKSYHPVSEEERERKRALIEAANKIVGSVGEIARASPADMLVPAMWAGDRTAIARDAEAAITWLQQFLAQHAQTPLSMEVPK